MTRNEVLKAFEQLSTEDQQAVRAELTKGASDGAPCCGGEEMKEHMESMMKMMHSSDDPSASCEQMMAMCQKMMQQKMQPSSTPA